MFSNRKMPEAPDFDENQKSIFLTCRSKIAALCVVTEYQCDSFPAVGSHILTENPCTNFKIMSDRVLWQIQASKRVHKTTSCKYTNFG